MNEPTERFCCACDHSRDTGRGTPENLTCESPKNYVDHVDQTKYLVTGIVQPTKKAIRGGDCHTLRRDHGPQMEPLICGQSGKWFEPKAQSSGVVGDVAGGA